MDGGKKVKEKGICQDKVKNEIEYNQQQSATVGEREVHVNKENEKMFSQVL